MREREYIVLEEWDAYVEVVVSAPNKTAALSRAKEILNAPDGEEAWNCSIPIAGNPTGKYEVRRV